MTALTAPYYSSGRLLQISLESIHQLSGLDKFLDNVESTHKLALCVDLARECEGRRQRCGGQGVEGRTRQDARVGEEIRMAQT